VAKCSARKKPDSSAHCQSRRVKARNSDR
jgi:hypothetical protein